MSVTVKDLEYRKSQLLDHVERRATALRLSQHPDFKKLILEEFMLHEAARYVQMSGDPALTKDQRQDALNIAQSTGHLKRFLSVIVQMGNVAENDLKDMDEALTEARASEDNTATDLSNTETLA